MRLNNLKAAQTAYEQAVATGGYSPEELPKTYRLLFQLAATNKSDAKAIEYGKQAADAGSATDDDLLIMSQLYYQEKDCKNSGVWGDKAIAAFKKAGQPPKEVLFQLKLQCASDANDTNGMKSSLYDLVRLTNKTSYWNNLIRLERQDERDDHNTLMIYRIMYDTNSMNADTDYHRDGAVARRCRFAGRGPSGSGKGDEFGGAEGRAQGTHHAPVGFLEDARRCRQEGRCRNSMPRPPRIRRDNSM